MIKANKGGVTEVLGFHDDCDATSEGSNVLTLLGVRIDGDRLRGSMATLEQIIEEVKKLPTEEKLRLRAALEQLTDNSDEVSPYRTREDKRVWLEAHGDEFL